MRRKLLLCWLKLKSFICGWIFILPIHSQAWQQFAPVSGIKTEHFSLHQAPPSLQESQLLLRQRTQLCRSVLSKYTTRLDGSCSHVQKASLHRTGGSWPKNQTATYMFKFLHAVLHGSGKSLIPFSSLCLVDVRWRSCRAETDRMMWDRPRRGCASGRDFPLWFGCWDGETTLRSRVTRSKGNARPSDVNPLHTLNFLFNPQ